jgi:hypothetical protein
MPMPLSEMVIGLRVLVERDRDLQFMVVAVQGVVVDRLEAQLVGGVGSVRDQFAQEDLLVRIQGVDHQLQQLFYFCLEAKGFFFGDSHFVSS